MLCTHYNHLMTDMTDSTFYPVATHVKGLGTDQPAPLDNLNSGFIGLCHSKTYFRAYEDSEGLDQPARPRRLIRAYAVR